MLLIAVSTPLLYIGVVLLIRLSGKRSTSQMNNFDWIVTVAAGSVVASGVLPNGIGLLEAGLAITLLIGLQYILTWVVIRNERLADLVKAAPRLLAYRGELLPDAMRKERVSERELMSAVRESGRSTLEEVEAVVLETDATFSVLGKKETQEQNSALQGVTGFPPN